VLFDKVDKVYSTIAGDMMAKVCQILNYK
jgi:hypothetical protein